MFWAKTILVWVANEEGGDYKIMNIVDNEGFSNSFTKNGS